MDNTKTINQRPIQINELNTALPQSLRESEKGILSIIAKVYRGLLQIISGMYTGTGCGGSPLEFHKFSDKKKTPPIKAPL
jgi:hypothetical protein